MILFFLHTFMNSFMLKMNLAWSDLELTVQLMVNEKRVRTKTFSISQAFEQADGQLSLKIFFE